MKKLTLFNLLFFPLILVYIDIVAQSSLSGHITNLETSTPFQFVTVKAIGSGTYTTETDSDGYSVKALYTV